MDLTPIVVGLLIVTLVLIALGLADIIIADRRLKNLNNRLNNLGGNNGKRR